MSKIQAQIIADSVNEFGNRITTMVVTFPRIILAEFNTHRMFSRNSASSRAIPFEKMVKSVQENPFIPIAWQKDHKGMQGNEYFTEPLHIEQLENNWLNARDAAIEQAVEMNENGGVTKQLCNRLLEPFMWHTVLITATDFENFFELRCPQYSFDFAGETFIKRSRKEVINHLEGGENWTEVEWLQLNKGQAEIHMMALAEAMWGAYNESTPRQLKAGEWHIPFGSNFNQDKLSSLIIKEHYDVEEFNRTKLQIKIATARCARVSYTVVGEEGKSDNYENDIKLHDRLAASGHASPFEHIAQCMSIEEYEESTLYNLDGTETKGVSRNFRGFKQYRELMKL